MVAFGWEMLLLHLAPTLRLGDLQALGGTCRGLRNACKSLAQTTWLTAARNSLPEEHPICLGSTDTTVPEHADHLARLHKAVRSGRQVHACSLVTLQSQEYDNEQLDRLMVTPSPEGTMLVSEEESDLLLYEMLAEEELRLKLVARLPAPTRHHKGQAFTTAFWAPDSATVLLTRALQQDAVFWDELYMVEIKRPALQLLKQSQSGPCTGIEFALDCQSFVVGWCREQDPCTNTFDVFKQCGQLTASLTCVTESSDPSWVVVGGKLIVAHFACFMVWDISSGQQATHGPDTASTSLSDEGGGQVASSPSGSKVAFSPAAGQHMVLPIHVYDAVSLQHLVTFHPTRNAMAADPLCCSSLTSDLFWEVDRFMLAYSDDLFERSWNGCLQIMAPQAASATYQQILLEGCEPRQPLALSPCASFVLLFQQYGANLEVRDVRTGTLVMALPTGLPDAHSELDLKYSFALRWSSCGSRLTARVRAQERCDTCPWAAERIVVAHLM